MLCQCIWAIKKSVPMCLDALHGIVVSTTCILDGTRRPTWRMECFHKNIRTKWHDATKWDSSKSPFTSGSLSGTISGPCILCDQAHLIKRSSSGEHILFSLAQFLENSYPRVCTQVNLVYCPLSKGQYLIAMSLSFLVVLSLPCLRLLRHCGTE